MLIRGCDTLHKLRMQMGEIDAKYKVSEHANAALKVRHEARVEKLQAYFAKGKRKRNAHRM